MVPAYNTGNLLKECINSILLQTYTNFECIIINDGSTDNTGDLCEQFQKTDERIRVISKKNEGLSIARNIAVREAKGFYLMFVDSDDYLMPCSAEIMIEAIEKAGTDAAMCKYFSKDKPPKEVGNEPIYEVRDSRSLCSMVLRDEIGSQLWQFMFKKEQWDGIISPPGRFAQDMMVLHKVIDKMKCIALLDEYLYHYYASRSNNTSNAKVNRTKGRYDRCVAFWGRLEFAKENQYSNDVDKILLNAVLFSLRALSKSEALDGKYVNDFTLIQESIKQNRKAIMKSRLIPGRKKFAALAISRAPRIYVRFRAYLR